MSIHWLCLGFVMSRIRLSGVCNSIVLGFIFDWFNFDHFLKDDARASGSKSYDYPSNVNLGTSVQQQQQQAVENQFEERSPEGSNLTRGGGRLFGGLLVN